MKSFNEFLVEKPLTTQQRLQRSRTFKRLAPKIALKRKQALKKKASPEKIKARAMKQARELVRAKFIKGKYDDLTNAEKIQVDKKLEKKGALIKKIAKKLLPKIKKAETERLAKSKSESVEIEEGKDTIRKDGVVVWKTRFGNWIFADSKKGENYKTPEEAIKAAKKFKKDLESKPPIPISALRTRKHIPN